MFRIATKERARMVLSLVGESGAGKTYSALRIASGITTADKIYIIDSEGRADLYCDTFGSYNVANVAEHNLSKNRKRYHPMGYIELINEAVLADAGVIIVDSLSHAWENEGGCLDLAENQFYNSGKKMAGMDKWKMPKALWKNLIQTILDSSINIIITFKAQRVNELDEDGKPMKDETLKIIRENKAPFDLTCELLLDTETKSPVEYLKMAKGLEWIFPKGSVLAEDTGKKILEWRKARPQEEIIKEGREAKDKTEWANNLPRAEKMIAIMHKDLIKE